MGTKISYCHECLNPIVGCSPDMPCADNCWARRTVKRLSGKFPEYRKCLTSDGEQWSGNILWRPEELHKLARWKKGRRILMVSHGDLFGPNIKAEWIDRTIEAMKKCSHHRYLVLSKHPETLNNWIYGRMDYHNLSHIAWGVSVMDYRGMGELNEFLSLDPAFKRWISFEPLMTPVSQMLRPTILKRLSWVIVGSLQLPSHKTAGWAKEDYAGWWKEAKKIESLCKSSGVAYFLKQYPYEGKVLTGPIEMQEIPRFLQLPWE